MDKTLCFKTKYLLSASKWLLISVALIFILNDCTTKDQSEIRILFTGDILLSRNVKLEIEQKQINPWYSLERRFKSENLVIGNLEGSVGTYDKSSNSSSSDIIFDIPKSYIPLLKEAGFSAVSLENNHSNDLGERNKDTTVLEVKKTGIAPISFENSPWFFRFNNTVISIIAVNLIPDKKGKKETIPSIAVSQKIRLARELSDFVIISIHWGNELLDWPSKAQRVSAEWLIENGADLIIGHHPHVIQAPEMINGKPVFFSLGNHLFDQKYSDSKVGLMVECVIKRGIIEFNGFSTHTIRNSYSPEIVKESHFNFSKLKITPHSKFSGFSLIPISVIDSTGYKIALEGHSGNRKIWTTPPISLISISTANFDNKNQYIFSLEKHYSSIDKEIALRPYVYSISELGLNALWRGSALSRPLIDAVLTPDKKYLVALHRGDSFIKQDLTNGETRIELYKWNGFGFSGFKDEAVMDYACKYYNLN
jgi:poly-gamma-glutamate synthesis protein (capsule biosynthesis protein)